MVNRQWWRVKDGVDIRCEEGLDFRRQARRAGSQDARVPGVQQRQHAAQRTGQADHAGTVNERGAEGARADAAQQHRRSGERTTRVLAEISLRPPPYPSRHPGCPRPAAAAQASSRRGGRPCRFAPFPAFSSAPSPGRRAPGRGRRTGSGVLCGHPLTTCPPLRHSHCRMAATAADAAYLIVSECVPSAASRTKLRRGRGRGGEEKEREKRANSTHITVSFQRPFSLSPPLFFPPFPLSLCPHIPPLSQFPLSRSASARRCAEQRLRSLSLLFPRAFRSLCLFLCSPPLISPVRLFIQKKRKRSSRCGTLWKRAEGTAAEGVGKGRDLNHVNSFSFFSLPLSLSLSLSLSPSLFYYSSLCIGFPVL